MPSTAKKKTLHIFDKSKTLLECCASEFVYRFTLKPSLSHSICEIFAIALYL